MSRLQATFATCARDGRAALVAFVTGGDGDTPASLDALVAGGADIIELGMPFTDPMADGPAIQSANIRSLKAGTTTAKLLTYAKDFRARHAQTPLVLMGYANPMVRRGAEWFAHEAASAGVDGVICVDMPPEEDEALGPPRRAARRGQIRLGTPTPHHPRLPPPRQGNPPHGGRVGTRRRTCVIEPTRRATMYGMAETTWRRQCALCGALDADHAYAVPDDEHDDWHCPRCEAVRFLWHPELRPHVHGERRRPAG